MTVSLLTTKLLIPPVNVLQVRRQRLWLQLEGSLQHALTLISAPAGYGKTNLLSAWVNHALERANGVGLNGVAWVALDEADDEPVRFWSYVLAALNRLPGLSEKPGNETTNTGIGHGGSVEAAVVQTVNALASCLTPTTNLLVLDDYHFITTPAIHDGLSHLLEHLPPSLHLIIASRADPPLALARLRVRGELLEIRAHDLRFQVDEAGDIS